ncbi:MAG: tetratricopeptide (TPR) repeat protein [Lentimonas sp.]|jgi:tetratricopeptide (TPR) repeat protein
MRTSGASIGDEADSLKLTSFFVEGNAPSLPLCRRGVWKRQSVSLQEYLLGLVSSGIAGCIFWLVLCLACVPTSMLRAEAQVQAFPDLDLPTLGQRAQAAFQAHPEEAIPYMLEIRGRLTGAASDEYLAIYRENIFMLGLAHMKWFQASGDVTHLSGAIPYWDEFVKNFLSDERHLQAMFNWADCLYGVEQWDDSVTHYLDVFRIYSQQLDADDLLGLLNRLVESAAAAQRDADIQDTLWQCLDDTYSSEIRLFCLNALFDRALVTSELNDLLKLVVKINEDRGFRYDLGINLRLLSVGDRFEEEEQYLEAGLLFSMVLPVEQLLFVVEDRLIELEERLFKRQYIASKKAALVVERDQLGEQRVQLAEAPKYTANLRWRQARVLRLMGRTYEAYFGFRRLIEDYPQHKHTEQFRYAAILQGLECGYTADAVEMAETYLDEPAFVLFEKPIAVQLARLYEQAGEVEKLYVLADEFLHRFPFEPLSAQMTHSLGHAWFVKGETEAILEDFPIWSEEFPDGAFIDSVEYWSGMAYLFVGDFEQALRSLEALIEAHPGSVYFQEARFRRGVAYFGMGDYPQARVILEEWVAAAGNHPLQAEAHVFLGDLDAMEAAVEEALQNYELVEAYQGAQSLIDHAYFESASLLLANQRFADHDVCLQRYLERFPDSPAGAEAVMRMADANLERGEVAAAFEYYRDGISRFGNKIESDHVDLLIDAWWQSDAAIRGGFEETNKFISQLLADETFRSEMLNNRVAQIGYFQAHPSIPVPLQESLTIRQPLYVALKDVTAASVEGNGQSLEINDYPELADWMSQSRSQLDQLPDELPTAVFKAMRTQAVADGASALALRLLRVLNQRADVEVSPVQLGFDEVELASPATLVWIAGIEAQKDPIEARGLLLQAIERAPTGPAVVDALFMFAELEAEDGFFDSAADYYERILNDHFDSERAQQSARARGDALRLARRYDDAIEAYTLILNQRGWRGEIWAEATFNIGRCFLDMNQIGKAQGFFERTYLAYGGYPMWAGKAVMESAALLEASGDIESARRTYEFFVNSPRGAESPLYEVARQRINTLQTP